MARPAKLDDVDWLEAQYCGRRRSAYRIAVGLGCSVEPVYGALARFGIPRRSRGGPAVVRAGQRSGRLVVVREEGRTPQGQRKFFCRCDCGGEVVVASAGLRRKHPTRSCGCLVRDVHWSHGHSVGGRSPTYESWKAMRDRCYRPSIGNYEKYGGRGITVCDRWRESFENFLEDMGERPEGRTLDRIDGEGNYEPANCRWATLSEQNLNRRRRG